MDTSLEVATRVLGASHPNTLTALGNLGELLALEGRPAEALPLLTTSLEGTRQALAPTHVNVGIALRKYGACLTALRPHAEAEAALLQAYEIIRSAVGAEHHRTRAVVHDLIALYRTWGKPDQVSRWQRS
ncbi:MAG TPA: tetratricopeptide repeat protein [Candidatus Polarisedimenticolaceae bacterium]|nr:tetratricopeptide repeat protein [Candidatus Polarisedimenticolaceae bacterium]